jgi:hypothetical protein
MEKSKFQILVSTDDVKKYRDLMTVRYENAFALKEKMQSICNELHCPNKNHRTYLNKIRITLLTDERVDFALIDVCCTSLKTVVQQALHPLIK